MEIGHIKGEFNIINEACFSIDNNILFTTSSGYVNMWNLKNRKKIYNFIAHDNKITFIKAYENFFVTFSFPEIKVWKIKKDTDILIDCINGYERRLVEIDCNYKYNVLFEMYIDEIIYTKYGENINKKHSEINVSYCINNFNLFKNSKIVYEGTIPNFFINKIKFSNNKRYICFFNSDIKIYDISGLFWKDTVETFLIGEKDLNSKNKILFSNELSDVKNLSKLIFSFIPKIKLNEKIN
jgi:hypothetical protein